MSTQHISRVGIIGLGAMGKRVLTALQNDHLPQASFAAIDHAVHSDEFIQAHRLEVFTDVQGLIDWRPDIVVECAGHSAVTGPVLDILRSGIDVVIASIGALADKQINAALDKAAHDGESRLILVSGAIGGLDALRSARSAGLEAVVYVGRKPPRAWAGSPAEEEFDLSKITEPTTIFRGTAAEASIRFPKNANVTAAVALSGVGFENTLVELVADPGVDRNVHEVQATGAFGELSIRLANNPLPDNPRTSWLAALSIEEAVAKQLHCLVF